MRASPAMRRAMASSTSSPADGSPRQLTDSSMALCDTVPRAVCVDQAKSSASWARKRPSQPWTELSRCFDTHSTSPSGSRSATGRQPVLQLGPQLGAQPRVELRALVGPGAEGRQHLGLGRVGLAGRGPRPPPPNDVTPPGLNGPSALVHHPPLRPGRPDPRRRRPRASASSCRASAARPDWSACCDRSSAGTAAPPSRWSCGAVRGRRCRPT